MGYLRFLYQLDLDPLDGNYQPYEFKPINMSLSRDFARRESVAVVPSADSLLDYYGRAPGPMDRRDVTFSFQVFTTGDNDAAYDRLAAWLAPGKTIRLVYQTDQGALWYTVAHNPRISNTATSASNWGTGGVLDFTIAWRIRPDWRPRFSQNVAGRFIRGSVFIRGSTFGSGASTTISAIRQVFTVNATGVAGVDLPTIADTGPSITITGPAGGAGGLRVVNYSATVRDAGGSDQPCYCDIPIQLVNATDTVSIKFAAQSFLHVPGSGNPAAAFRPLKPDYQREYFRIEPGIVNSCEIQALTAGRTAIDTAGLTGGALALDWYKKRA